MRVIVCVKETVDLQQVRMDRDTREPVPGVVWLIGEIDKNALEEAVRIKQATGARITALSAGWPQSEETLLEVLARGADEVFSVADPALASMDPAIKAQVLARAIQKIGPFDLVLMAQGSADNNSGQTGPRVAGILDVPQIGFVRRLDASGGSAVAVRNLEDCLETVEVPFPAVINVSAEINEPSIPPITAILEASSKPTTRWTLSDIGMGNTEIKADTRMVSNRYPSQQRKNVILPGGLNEAVDRLVRVLVQEGGLEV